MLATRSICFTANSSLVLRGVMASSSSVSRLSTSTHLARSSEQGGAPSGTEGQQSTPPPSSSSAAPGEGRVIDDETKKIIEELQKKLTDADNRVLELKAEVYNVRRRSEKDLQNERDYGLTKFAKDLLGIMDTFEKALETVPADQRDSETASNKELNGLYVGINMTYENTVKTLAKHGVVVAEPGTKFNPEIHEATAILADPSKENNAILHVIRKGYMLRERVLRATQVVINKV